jgi:hypothetical protein
MKTTFFNSMIFSKEERESLKKLRIIQQNLIHVQGLPRSLNSERLLESQKYFGQYGTIKNIILCKKINPENNKEVYSVYITYGNEIQAAIAISCVDSLLIEGKIIRAFFGTTKYCNYFLNSTTCPNRNKCIFLHELAADEDIIINNDTKFSYDDHLNLAKQILKSYNIKNFRFQKNIKVVFPPISFIYLTEEEKERFLESRNLGYAKDKSIIKNDSNMLYNSIHEISGNNEYSFNISKSVFLNNNNIQLSNNIININYIYKPSNSVSIINKNDNKAFYSEFMDKSFLPILFSNSIDHILFAKPFFMTKKNIPLRKLELEYVKDDLKKYGIDVYKLLEGCLF